MSRMPCHAGTSQRRSVLSLAALASVALVAVVAPAGTNDISADLAALSLEELMQIPVYAASRFAQKIEDAPSWVTIITAEQIRAYGYRTLGEILSSVPGLYVTYDRSYHYLGVRGFCRPGDYNSRVLVLLNGHRTNDGVYDSASIDESFAVDVDLIERIEVVRGPSSSLYGSSAFFAVVNIITRQGDELNGVEYAVSAGSFDTFTARITHGIKFGERGSLLLSLATLRSAGQSLYFSEFDSPETHNGIADGDDRLTAQNMFMLFVMDNFRFELSFSDRDKVNPTAAWDTIFDDPGTKDRDRQVMADMSYSHKFADCADVSARLRCQRYTYQGDMAYANSEPGDPVARIVNRDAAEAAWWGGELRADSEFISKNRVSAGIEYRNNFRLNLANSDVETGEQYLDDRRQSEVWGFYAQDEIRVTDAILLNGGVRYDRSEPSGGGAVSPKAGVILRPLKDTTLKLLYGKAFRAPNEYELYYNDGGRTMKANPNLEPESIETYELVVEQRLGEQLRASLSVFKYDIENLIGQAEDAADGLLFFDNMDDATAKGAEVSVQASLPGKAELSASYSYADARDGVSGERLSNSPEHLAKLNAIVPLVEKRLLAGVEVQYTGERRTLSGGTLNDFVVANLNLTTKLLDGRLDAAVGVYNLFGEQYWSPGSGEHRQDAIEQDGRTFRAKATYRF